MKNTAILSNVVGWAIVIAFTATLVLTILGMIDVVHFANPEHLDKLVVAGILEVLALGFWIYKRGDSGVSRYFNRVSSLLKGAREKRLAKNYDEAEAMLGEIFRVSDEELPFRVKDIFLERGEIAYERKLWRQAAEAMSIYLELTNDDVTVLVKTARALRELHEYERARSLLERAHALSPQDYAVLNGLQNCIRRLGAFHDDGVQRDVADRYFEQAREYINNMLRIADANSDKKKRLNALIARARLNWEWKRHEEAAVVYEEIIAEFPERAEPREDLAALLLEHGAKIDDQIKIEKAHKMYAEMLLEPNQFTDAVFVGGGLAEAAALMQEASDEDLQIARRAALAAIANNDKARDDPYAMYAAAVLLKRLGEVDTAKEYLRNAIRAEKKRSNNPYVFDYERLFIYERLLEEWESSRGLGPI
jgi:tetratricopeptide (TPR) repeat protein